MSENKETYESVVQRRDELAAENAELNFAIDKLINWPGLEIYTSAWEFNNSDGYEAADLLDLETPATDEFTRELMAKGVEDAASSLFGAGYSFDLLMEYATQLRKGINDAQ